MLDDDDNEGVFIVAYFDWFSVISFCYSPLLIFLLFLWMVQPCCKGSIMQLCLKDEFCSHIDSVGRKRNATYTVCTVCVSFSTDIIDMRKLCNNVTKFILLQQCFHWSKWSILQQYFKRCVFHSLFKWLNVWKCRYWCNFCQFSHKNESCNNVSDDFDWNFDKADNQMQHFPQN